VKFTVSKVVKINDQFSVLIARGEEDWGVELQLFSQPS